MQQELIKIKRDGHGKIWSHIRKKWLVETPEETVRQDYLCTLVNEYGYVLAQIDEEISVDGRGSGDARADFLIWRTPKEKTDRKTALIVIECKADNVAIDAKAYQQGANYAQYERAKFFVTHNHRTTKFWKVDLEKRMPNFDEIENIPHANASDDEIDELVKKLKVFKEDEFADLLHQCHNVIRNREKKDPAAAFDEIAKVLFVKVWVEREMKRKRQYQNLFTADWLDSQLGDHPLNVLFLQTKEHYKTDFIFKEDEQINLKPATGREIVKLLERYNLSDTSEDIKGIAFERFLGRTFRGEIGQFFTPRTIVEFMIHMVEPKEGETICDPASGSGGFLIRFFEIVRQQIFADADRQYQEYKSEIISDSSLTESERATCLRSKYEEIQGTLDASVRGSRTWILSNRCIYGTDANDRMARTSKMNMIMHGDGHGGVHHHDGFLNVNGIFEGRFDIVLTNPPFGSNVEPTDVVMEEDIRVSDEAERYYAREYGDSYIEARERTVLAVNKPIISLFELPKQDDSKVKTEVLFIERCLNLLKPGGRLGIVLPEGVFNNSTLSYVREFCENRAFIDAVVSLPPHTFKSSDADVKASLLFMRKFTEQDAIRYEECKKTAEQIVQAKYSDELECLKAIINQDNYKQKDFLGDLISPTKEQKVEASEKAKAANSELKFKKEEAKARLRELQWIIRGETRSQHRKLFNYHIFMYEAERVGITATGDVDQNELLPNSNIPSSIEKTCLELYREFKDDPEAFLRGKKYGKN